MIKITIDNKEKYERLLDKTERKNILEKVDEIIKMNHEKNIKKVLVITLDSVKDWKVGAIAKNSNFIKFIKKNKFDVKIKIGKIYKEEFNSIEATDYTINKINDIAKKASLFKTDFEKVFVSSLLIKKELIPITKNIYPYVKEKYGLKYTKKEEQLIFGIRTLQALYTKHAVCVAYSKILVAVLEILGIESVRISGIVPEDTVIGHSYNIVKIDDNWYLWDITEDGLMVEMFKRVVRKKANDPMQRKNLRSFKGFNGIYDLGETFDLRSTNKEFLEKLYNYMEKNKLKKFHEMKGHFHDMLDFVSKEDLDVFIKEKDKIYIKPKYIKLIENIANNKEIKEEIEFGYKEQLKEIQNLVNKHNDFISNIEKRKKYKR